MRFRTIATAAAVAACAPLLADPALAGGAGGSMPYSSFLTSVRNSLSGEFALTLAVICFTVGLGMWLVGQDMHGPVLFMVRGAVVCTMMLGVLALLTSFGVAGAMVA